MMNESIHPDRPANVPWLSSDQRITAPETSMWPASEKAVPAAVDLLDIATQSAHDTIDRIAASAKPVVRHLGNSVSSAAEALHTKTDQLRVSRDEWANGARTTVRSHPLVSVAAAFTLGTVIGRLLKGSGRRNG